MTYTFGLDTFGGAVSAWTARRGDRRHGLQQEPPADRAEDHVGADVTPLELAGVALGEGLLGQCAIDKRRLLITEIPSFATPM